ncbi:MAG: amino acid adenylation domain-containing protein [Polyangiaceae bacterium]|nr:amino acid adenylation domain-containing protein [Polyangiaceae bacterium]
MVFHSLRAPRSGVYVQQFTVRLHETLDLPAFQEAFRRLQVRHDTLRTTFHLDGESGLVQRVHETATPSWALESWEGLAVEEQDARFRALLAEDRRRGFNLGEAPPLRFTMIQLGPADHLFLWTYHHALLDGRSQRLLLEEVFATYDARREGREPERPPVAPFRDLLRWLEGRDAEGSKDFWQEHLRGFSAPTPLPVAPQTSPNGAADGNGRPTHETLLSEEETSALVAFASKHALTLGTLVQAAWAALIERYGGGEDVVFGATRACRYAPVPGIAQMIGLLINTVPMRVRVDPDRPVLDWLREVRATWVAIRPHEHSALKDIQGWSEVERGSPLFESLLVIEDRSHGDAAITPPGSRARREIQLIERGDEVLVGLAYGGKRLQLRVSGDRARFDDAMIARMGSHWKTLLLGLAEDPARRVADLPLLGESEQQALLRAAGRGADTGEAPCRLHDLFTAQAARTPDRIALRIEEESLSYRELDARASQLAHHLQHLGVGPEVRVAIGLDRGAPLLVAVLAVLKAGGAYVPLDPDDPPAQREFKLVESGAAVLIGRHASWDEVTGSEVLRVDPEADAATILAQSREAPPCRATPENLAYAIYTSGSTGRPKLVGVEHRSAVNVIRYTTGSLLEPRDFAYSPFTLSICFDPSVHQIFCPWAVGGSVVLLESLGALPRSVHASALTFLGATPSVLAALLDDFELPASVRVVNLGAEAPSEALLDRLTLCPSLEKVLNLYGPTEATIYCSQSTLLERRASRLVRVAGTRNIGRPVANCRIHLLDARRRLVPDGVIGELFVGGECLSRGYLNQPERTQESFAPDPFSSMSGARLYRTGDRGRRLADGSIELVGRIDDQIKLHGLRIEPGSIEATLGEHPDVRDCVVRLFEGAGGAKQLVAWVVPTPSGRAQSDQAITARLRVHLETRLPRTQVPRTIVLLNELPRTSRGKVNARALPAPAADASETSSVAAPGSPVEAALVQIWEDILPGVKVQVHDDFVKLGGNSLGAMRVVGRVNQTFGVDLSLQALFEAPRLADLARVIEALLDPSGRAKSTTIPRVPRDGALPLSFAQQRLWFLDKLEPNSAVYNIPLSVRVSGPLSVSALERSLSALTDRHESLRTTFPESEGVPRQEIARVLHGSLPVIDLESHPAALRELEVTRLLRDEASRPFDLSAGPLSRSTLLRLSAEEHVLLWTFHHIIADGFSLGVLTRELWALYEAFSTDQPPPSLPPLDIQVADHAVWQRERLLGDVLRAQLDYWKKQLAGVPPALEIQTDRPRPAQQTYRGAVLKVAISRELTAGLNALGRREGVTLFMTLLAAFGVLLARYTGQDDIVVGSPIAGRTSVETEGLVGLFIHTLVLRTDLSGDPTFLEVLRRVREVTLSAYSHQEVPFEKLVVELSPTRDLSRSPLFQVMLVLQSPVQSARSAGALTLGAAHIEQVAEKFDLSLSLSETEDGLRGTLGYSTDLFDAATIARMIGHFQVLLESIVTDAGRVIGALSILSPGERDTLLFGWNTTERAFPADRAVHELFEAQVEKTPEKTAVVFDGQEISYRVLNEQANRLARRLIALGAGPGALVGLCVERSPLMVVGLLGILKAGAAYVPLDPGYPAERLAFMLRDAGVELLVTDEVLTASLPRHDARTVALDAEADALADGESGNLPRRAGGEERAYVLYTSGSTGRPKGVIVPHRALVNFLSSMAREPGLGETDTLVAVTTLSFDIAGLEIFLPLTTGAKLVIASAETAADGRELRVLLESSGATALQATPATWRLLLGAEFRPSGDFKVLCGGEALPSELVAPLLMLGGRVWNMYGPTETTIWSTCAEITTEDPRVTIGRPIDNTFVYVLDGRGEPVPVGVRGELFIGGQGVSLGYLGRTDLTAERFMPDPFRGGDARMYRTGDLVSLRADGSLLYHRRLDEQLKIRGHRIEPGEIEAVLSEHAAVSRCAVIVREDRPGDARLAAYLVPRSGQSITASDVRKHLRKKLPEYMIPQHVVELTALPLTPAGKLARRELPAPTGAGPSPKARRPETPGEKALARIWSEVLGTDLIAATDNFFDLGGHSLLSMMVVARIHAQTGFHVTPRDLLLRSLEQIAAQLTPRG